LWDEDEGGFHDSEDALLGIKLKAIEDIPHPSANSVAIILLLKLHHLTDRNVFLDYAEKALKVFAVKAKDMGIHAGYYYSALDAYFHMLKLTLETSVDSALAETARSHSYPYMSCLYGEEKGLVIPCLKDVCLEPIKSPDMLREFLDRACNPSR
jgi:uncharacterized protein YyaL (SSP411 family)